MGRVERKSSDCPGSISDQICIWIYSSVGILFRNPLQGLKHNGIVRLDRRSPRFLGEASIFLAGQMKGTSLCSVWAPTEL